MSNNWGYYPEAEIAILVLLLFTPLCPVVLLLAACCLIAHLWNDFANSDERVFKRTIKSWLKRSDYLTAKRGRLLAIIEENKKRIEELSVARPEDDHETQALRRSMLYFYSDANRRFAEYEQQLQHKIAQASLSRVLLTVAHGCK